MWWDLLWRFVLFFRALFGLMIERLLPFDSDDINRHFMTHVDNVTIYIIMAYHHEMK